jgi:hypothetical protein
MADDSKKVIPGYVRTVEPPARQGRMIDFPTGTSTLLPEHMQWLNGIIAAVSQTTSFYVDLVGYASKAGNHNFNQWLSGQRNAVVAAYLQSRNKLVYPRIRHFLSRGDRGYFSSNPDDNSADERAVELLLYFGDIEPRPPIGVVPHPITLTKPPLPGGPRSSNWSVAGLGGFQVSAEIIATAGVNVFRFRNDDDRTTRTFACPGAGPGGSIGPPIHIGKAMKLAQVALKAALRTLLGGVSYAPTDYSKMKTITGFNFSDLTGTSALLSSAGSGIVGAYGYQKAYLKVYGKIWHYDSSGQPWFANADICSGDVSGKDFQLSVGASSVGGPLIEL